MNEEIKEKSKDIAIKLLEYVLKIIGIVGFSLFLMFRPIIQAIFSILIGGVGLYIFLGIIGVILCHVFSALGHAYLGH
jgi:predicted RND superfamily exporter protein